MKNSKIILTSFLNALGVAIYVSLVSIMMRNGGRIFGEEDNNFLGPIAFLLMFIISAAITGSLVVGRPILLYIENRKAEAVKLFIFTIGWLFIFTAILFGAQILR